MVKFQHGVARPDLRSQIFGNAGSRHDQRLALIEPLEQLGNLGPIGMRFAGRNRQPAAARKTLSSGFAVAVARHAGRLDAGWTARLSAGGPHYEASERIKE